MTEVRLEIPAEAAGMRLDRYIADFSGLLNRSQIKTRALVASTGDRPVKLSLKLKGGEVFLLRFQEPPPLDLLPEKMDLEILFENEDVAVINKSRGRVVHPGAGNYTGTLVQGFLAHCQGLKQAFPEEEIRPGVVHRLDKDTTGVIIMAKNPEALEFLARQFREKTAKKQYLAVVKGIPYPRSGTINANIGRDPSDRKRFTTCESGGKEAVTHYRLQKCWEDCSLLRLGLETGRTHQLRVHLKSIGHPILGDPVYTRNPFHFDVPGLMLHAYRLKILLPGEERPRKFSAPLPADFRACLRDL